MKNYNKYICLLIFACLTLTTLSISAQNPIPNAPKWDGPPYVPFSAYVKVNGMANIEFEECISLAIKDLCTESELDEYIVSQAKLETFYKKRLFHEGKAGYYIGPLKNGMAHGAGTFQYENGDWYKGFFAFGARDGYGISFWSSKLNKQQRRFSNGQLVWSGDKNEAFNSLQLFDTPERKEAREKLEVFIEYGATFSEYRLKQPMEVRNFYRLNEQRPIWVDQSSRQDFVKEIAMSAEQGFHPDDYHFTILKELIVNTDTLPELEYLLTDAWLLLAKHYSQGKLNPRDIDPKWHLKQKTVVNFKKDLYQQGLRGTQADFITMFLPDNQDYKKLQREMARYLRLNRDVAKWTTLNDTILLKKGSRGTAVIALARKLQQMNYYDGEVDSLKIFDDSLEKAVIEFQKGHGLGADGIVGKASYEALNLALDTRIQQISINLERMRWLPRGQQFIEKYITINIPSFELKLIENKRPTYEAKVAVGTVEHQTPVFQDEMDRIVFNPYWHIPPRLAREEILPEIIKDPSYLKRNDMKAFRGPLNEAVEVDPYKTDWTADYIPKVVNFRQESGRLNALGKVKFLFPNRFNIYLHDTPSKYVFTTKERAYSHGCIRLQNPLDFAKLLLTADMSLAEQASEIPNILATKKEQTLFFQQTIPVYITYFTAFVDQNGFLHFKKDIYNKDTAIYYALNVD